MGKKPKIIEIEEYPGQGDDRSTMEIMADEYGTWEQHDDVYYDKKNGTTISVDTYVENVHFFSKKRGSVS